MESIKTRNARMIGYAIGIALVIAAVALKLALR